ncbi:MAG: type II toxin-antitoxin system VapC family toxin [Solirubrobacteraceae bacterium]|nr:type II toxin-antitoxin system VapC family toxin [Solirubrobacteraceae bacterium]
MPTVLDASAVIAFLHDEPGASAVRASLDEPEIPLLSTVNLTEVAQHVGRDRPAVIDGLAGLVTIVDYDRGQAQFAARLHAETREAGLGLADRACLALAATTGSPALTADRAWSRLDVGVEIVQIR